MLLGFTFPFFWAYHAGGLAEFLYKPIQAITGSESKLWPSFITASLLYVAIIILIEMGSRPRRKRLTPEWHTHHQQPQSGHESFSPDHYIEKGPDQQHHQELSNDQAGSSPKTG